MLELFAAKPETPIYSIPKRDGRKKINTVLMGTWLGVEKTQGSFLQVRTAGPDGWVHKSDTRPDRILKVFFIDVGQGDGVLIETPENKRILVDGGPGRHTYNYLTKWQYQYLLNHARSTVHIDAVIISHFDADHYGGLIPILEDRRFTFGTIYHNGIARFRTNTKKKKRPTRYDQDLGTTTGRGKNRVLKTQFSTLTELLDLEQPGEDAFQRTFRRFAHACRDAKKEGRLGKLKLLKQGRAIPELTDSADGLSVETLGPALSVSSGKPVFKWFSDSSHTRNGHSIVLRLSHHTKSLLLGGDLNSASERHLLDHHGDTQHFHVDIAKSCHHGSSDFSIAFLQAVDAAATIISSGDNEGHAHPRADAIGAVAKYSSAVLPLIFSTELARSVNSEGDILFGMINLRSDEQELVLAQMKEAGADKDLWDSYQVPFQPTNHHKA